MEVLRDLRSVDGAAAIEWGNHIAGGVAAVSSRVLPFAVLFVVGCAPPPPPVTAPPLGNATFASARAWPIKTREHVDLWLHGFAMIADDSAAVPLFRRGYRDAMTVTKNSRNVLTQLDERRAELARGYKASPSYQAAQFIPLYFGSQAELAAAVQIFLASNGAAQRASTQEGAAIIGLFASAFPKDADRAWFKSFWEALLDEQARFYHDWWTTEQHQRLPALTAADSVWQRVRPRIQSFLGGTKQGTGDMVLSLPIGGEGRTVNGGKAVVIAVTFPERATAAEEATYVLVHEVAGTLAVSEVGDQTSPADKRNGVADRMVAAATVRAGALVLQKGAPELAEGYARYYLDAAHVSWKAQGGSAIAALERAFPIPVTVRDGMRRQIDILFGGI